MEKSQTPFELSFNKHLDLIALAVMNPHVYSYNLKTLSLKQGLIFFGINAGLWLLLFAVIRTVLIGRYYLFFAILSEALILLIPLFFGFLASGFILHTLSKVFRSRAKLKNNLKAVFFSSILLPFFAVPVFKVIAWIITIFVLIYCFKMVNRFDRVKATIVVIIPISIVLFALLSLGIVNINLATQ